MTLPNLDFDQSHFLQSSLREKVLEHLFVGELLRSLWRNGRRDIEVLRAEIDYFGYDLAIECNGALRHIQLKSSHRRASTRSVSINLSLATKSSGCVIWLDFDEGTLELGPFWWFGASPRERLPPLGDQIAKHTKANSAGIKALKPNLRILRKAQFTKLESIDEVVEKLFG